MSKIVKKKSSADEQKAQLEGVFEVWDNLENSKGDVIAMVERIIC